MQSESLASVLNLKSFLFSVTKFTIVAIFDHTGIHCGFFSQE